MDWLTDDAGAAIGDRVLEIYCETPTAATT